VYLASVIKKRPVVYDSHEYFTELPELVGRKTIRNIWKGIENLILPKIKYCYTVSDSIAADFNRNYGIAMKVVRNLPIRINELPSDDSLKKTNEKLVIYQGALNMGRGLEMAIAAMKHLNNCRLIIAGSGYLEGELKMLAESLDLHNKVQFFGMIRPDILVKYTVQADLGISLEENTGLNYFYALPNKLFDYIQARIPVLVSDMPEMSSIVKKYNIGKSIQTNDPLELAATMNEMLFSFNLREIWKQNLEKAANELCWENEESKLVEIYKSVIKDHAFLKAGK
jgi:glycosyltransferase involved in cell wall biosynthesis